MKQLDVPLVRQAKDSTDCGIAALQMILKYYDDNKLVEQLPKDIKADAHGTYAPQLCTYLMKQGYETEIIFFHPQVVTLQDVNISSAELILRFKAHTEDKVNGLAAKYFIEYLENGGTVRVKIPSADDVRKELEIGRMVLADLTTNFLRSTTPRFNLHFNVVSGIDEAHITVNDPLWDERGGKHRYPLEDWFFGLYSSVHAGFHEGTLTLIKRKDS